MKKQKFEIRIAVGGDDERTGVEIEVWKDGKPLTSDCLRAITCDWDSRV